MRGGQAGRPVLPVLVLGNSAETVRAQETLKSAGYFADQVDVSSFAGALTSRVWSLILTGSSGEEVDAVAVCKAVRSTPGRNSTPIVVLMDRAADAHPDEVLEAGANDFVLSPFEAAELLARIKIACRPRPSAGTDLQLAALVANLPSTVYRCEVDEFWTMLFVSDRIEEVTGYPAADFVANAQRSFVSIMHPDDRRPVESEVADAVHHGEPFEVRYRIVTAEGQIRHVVDRGRLVHDEDGRTWLDGILLDITARHDAEQRLREELANRAAIEERLRISRDMHDSVSQGLFSILTHARAAELALESSEADPSALESVAQLRATAEESLDDLRTTLVELRSEMSLGEDIAAGVRHLADRMTAGRKVSVEVDVASTVPKLPSDTADAVYWVVREAVHNAVKHAEPSGVTIVLSSTDDAEFQVEIRDDGVGFDSDVASTDRLGLTTMRERLARVNGRLEVVGDPGRGTVIRAVAPTVRKPGAAAAEGAP